MDQRLIAHAPAIGFVLQGGEHLGSMRMAMSCRATLPSGGRPTRCMARSCSSDDSGRSEKSIPRGRVRRPFFAARRARRDDPDVFDIALPPSRIAHHEQPSGCCPRQPTIEHRGRFVKAYAMLDGIGGRLSRVPLEHRSVYTKWDRLSSRRGLRDTLQPSRPLPGETAHVQWPHESPRRVGGPAIARFARAAA